MCGLFGWDLRKASITREQMIVMATVLAAMNDNRGGDSWGYYNPDKDDLYHELGDSLDEVLRVTSLRRVMCHTRKATTGSVSKDNAHPFRIGNIVGAHNGMIHNHSDLNKEFKRECVVDSQHIFHNINEGKDLKSISGYGVITFFDTRAKDRVNLCRVSGGGDLSVFGIGEHAESSYQGVVWSSTETALKQAFKAAGIKGFPFEAKAGQKLFIEQGKLYLDEGKYEFGEYKSSSYQSPTSGERWSPGGPYGAHYAGYYRGEVLDDASAWRTDWDAKTPAHGTAVATDSKKEKDSQSYFDKMADNFECYGKMFSDGDSTCEGCAAKASCRAEAMKAAALLGSKAKSENLKSNDKLSKSGKTEQSVLNMWELVRSAQEKAKANETKKEEATVIASSDKDEKEELVTASPHAVLVSS